LPKEKTFNFPLCLLAYKDNIKDRLNVIISFAIVDNAHRLLNNKQLNNELEGFMGDELEKTKDYFDEIPDDYDDEDETHNMILISAHRKGVIMGNVKSNVELHNKA